MQGLRVMIDLMKNNERASTRALAAEVSSVVVQNNPFSQNAAVECGLVEELCALAKDPDATCRVKSMLAISCLVRHHPAAEARFLSESCNGLSILEGFLKSTDLRLQRKSLFFVRYLIRNSAETAKFILENGSFIPTATGLIANEDIDLSESSLEALTEFASLGSAFTAACQKPEYALLDKLSDRIAQIEAMNAEDKEFHVEILNMARNLKNILAA
jgi:hypothetical protein